MFLDYRIDSERDHWEDFSQGRLFIPGKNRLAHYPEEMKLFYGQDRVEEVLMDREGRIIRVEYRPYYVLLSELKEFFRKKPTPYRFLAVNEHNEVVIKVTGLKIRKIFLSDELRKRFERANNIKTSSFFLLWEAKTIKDLAESV